MYEYGPRSLSVKYLTGLGQRQAVTIPTNQSRVKYHVVPELLLVLLDVCMF
jgi:hypothetical protein